jgi:hypothetical protein
MENARRAADLRGRRLRADQGARHPDLDVLRTREPCHALASADPPERKKIHREPAALNGLNGHIDAIIEADPKVATATIWQRIADEHGTTVAYYTLRAYVASHRASWKTLGKSQRRDR